jgi:hypothetical protein
MSGPLHAWEQEVRFQAPVGSTVRFSSISIPESSARNQQKNSQFVRVLLPICEKKCSQIGSFYPLFESFRSQIGSFPPICGGSVPGSYLAVQVYLRSVSVPSSLSSR